MTCLKMVLILISLYTSAALAQGRFASGYEYTNYQMRGYLTLRCINTKTGVIKEEGTFCRSEKLHPVETDYFIGPSGLIADRVNFSVQHSNGNDRSRSENYDSLYGRTVNRVNLWNQNLFQKPILEKGQTGIQYSFTHRGVEKMRGSFVVTVTDGGVVRCKDGMYLEKTEASCSPASVYCDQYFSDFNFCN